jgi:hypothetical protein
MRPSIRAYTPVLLAALMSQLLPTAPKACAQTTAAAAELRISGAVSTPLVLTIGDLKKMPRKTLSVLNPHDKKTETYEGVLLEELLKRAGAPHGVQFHGKSMNFYVFAEAEDGYRVVFSLAGLDSGILESEVIVADTIDGAPLDAKQGPFRLALEDDFRTLDWSQIAGELAAFSEVCAFPEAKALPNPKSQS